MTQTMTDLMSSSSSNDPLLRLLQETASNDRDAFRLLYDSSSAKLFGVILRIVKRQDLAEEILQEVYLIIWNKANSYNPSLGRPLSWMMTIARNKALDTLRGLEAKSQTFEYSESDDAPIQSALLAVIPETLDTTDRMSLQNCLDEATEQARESVLLAYIHGFSRDELAARYCVPVNTIKTWLRRALIDLKNCLER